MNQEHFKQYSDEELKYLKNSLGKISSVWELKNDKLIDPDNWFFGNKHSLIKDYIFNQGTEEKIPNTGIPETRILRCISLIDTELRERVIPFSEKSIIDNYSIY